MTEDLSGDLGDLHAIRDQIYEHSGQSDDICLCPAKYPVCPQHNGFMPNWSDIGSVNDEYFKRLEQVNRNRNRG